MLYLVFFYLLFSIIVILRQRKSVNMIWFLLMPLGFSLALLGLLLFTEYVSYAKFIDNPLFGGNYTLIWKLNYYLDLSVIGMYRLMNIGVALYIMGAIGFPLSQYPRRIFRKRWLFLAAIPACLILLDDPGLLQVLFKPDSVFHGIQDVLKGLNVINRILNLIVKAMLIVSLIMAFWIHNQTPRIFRKRSQLIILGILPIHVLLLVLFHWFPSQSIHIWRLSSLNQISLPYSGLIPPLIVVLSLFSMAILFYTTILYNSFELRIRNRQVEFKGRVKTAGSGLRLFAHSIKNQFIAIKLLAEQERYRGSDSEYLKDILSVCEKTIIRLGAMPTIPERIDLDYRKIRAGQLLGKILEEYPQVCWENHSSGVTINVDEHYLGEVLRNLIINSQEAVKDLNSQQIVLKSFRQLNYLVIQVEDNGKGIGKDEIGHIFEPFYSTKPSISNWGMGLAFCQQIIEAFGGDISVESEPGVRTRFEIYIPEDHDGE